MVLSLAACGGGSAEPTKKPETYPKLMGKLHQGPGWVINELYVWNTHKERKVYTYEILPDTFDVNSGKKLPVIIYAHGGKGNADSLISEPKVLVADGIAGFTFEACGGSAVAPKSSEGVATSSSRASNMEAVLQYVKTLDWVDKDKIFIYGQSAGGSCVLHFAPKHNDDVAGMISESAGIGVGTTNDPKELGENDVQEFFPAPGQGVLDYYKSYMGDVIICNSEGDGNAVQSGENAVAIFNERGEGAGTAKFYFCPEGAHTFNSYSEEGQKITLDAIRELVLG